MILKVLFALLVSCAIIAGAVLCFYAINSLPIPRDLLGQIVANCLRAADVALAGASVIYIMRRAFR